MTKAEQIRAEIEALQKDGIVDAKDVVEWARANPESALYSQFEWDDSKAAEEYRLFQARRVIALYVVSEAGERTLVSLSVDRSKGGGYRDIERVLNNDEMRKVMLRDALQEFKRVKAKYQHLKELASVYEAIEDADKRYGKGDDDAQAVAA